MGGPFYRHERERERIGPVPVVVGVLATLGGAAAGVALLRWCVVTRPPVPTTIIGLAATFVIAGPAVWSILNVERARRRVYVARLAGVFAGDWELFPRPAWEELGQLFSDDEVMGWRRARLARPAFLAHGRCGAYEAMMIGPGGGWLVTEPGPEVVLLRLLAGQGSGTIWLLSDDAVRPVTITRRVGGRFAAGALAFGREAAPGPNVHAAVLSVVVIIALLLGMAMFVRMRTSMGLYGALLAAVLTSIVSVMVYLVPRHLIVSRLKRSREMASEGQTPPDFADVFDLELPRGDGWLLSHDAQRWLVQHRDLLLRVKVVGQRVGIAFMPGPGSRPGYPAPIDDETLRRMLIVAGELPRKLGLVGS